MICTEQEAKEKWCPQARIITVAKHMETSSAAYNRIHSERDPGIGLPGVGKCIGSACMMWAWAEDHDHRTRSLYSKKTGLKVTAAYGDDAEWRLDDPTEPEPEPCGTCGLIRSAP